MAKSITIQELQRAKDEWMCSTINELYDEMELWQWNAVQHNRCARALKASNRVGVRPMWYIDELEDGEKKLSWATATRSLRKLKARIIKWGANENNPRSRRGGSKMLRNGSSCSGGGSILEGVCLLLQYLLQSCSRGGGGGMEDMCYERLRAEASVN